MKLRNKLNELSLNASLGAYKALSALGLGLVTSECLADGAGVNRLEGLKNDVHATFGSGSDVEYILLLAQGLFCAYRYKASGNIAYLAGLPVLMVFTHFALK